MKQITLETFKNIITSRRHPDDSFSKAPAPAASLRDAPIRNNPQQDALTMAAIIECEIDKSARQFPASILVQLAQGTPILLAASLSIILQNGLLFLLSLGLLAITVVSNRASAARLVSKTALLTADFDLKNAGVLAELLEWPSPLIASVARLRLMRLMAYIGQEQADMFNESQRLCLRHILTLAYAKRNPEFVIATLECVGAIGDGGAYPFVKKLKSQFGLTKMQKRVKEAASNCLILLEEVSRDTSLQEETAHLIELSTGSNQPLQRNELDVQTQQKQMSGQRPGMRLGFLLASWCIILPYMLYLSLTMNWEKQYLLSFLFLAAGVAVTQLHRLTLTDKHLRMVRKLARSDDLSSIGLLAEALEWPDAIGRDIAIGGLTRLLPRCKVSDSNLLNADQRGAIYRMLRMENASTYYTFMEKTLIALQQIGDETAIPYVMRLANSQPFSRSAKQIMDIATESLPFLEIRAGQQKVSQTLLRASSQAASIPNEMLRPIFNNSEDHPEQLLRPGKGKDMGTLS